MKTEHGTIGFEKEMAKAFLHYVGALIQCNLTKFFRIFPLRKNRVLFISFDGKQYSDNPKYISEAIKKKFKDKEIVWAFYEPEQFDYLRSNGYELVKRDSLRYTLEMMTDGTIITNTHISNRYSKRRKQIVLNTWHGGSPLKTIGFAEAKQSFYNYYFYKMQESKYTAYLSSSDFMTKEVFDRSFGYKGKILKFGMPRNAVLLSPHEEVVQRVFDYFRVKRTDRSAIVLYAPTFRGDYRGSSFLCPNEQFDIQTCVEILNKRFNKDFIFLFRAHHAMKDTVKGSNFILATDYPDMQELLCAADVLLTDYSSCMGDMALMKKPVFLYAPDLEEYIKDRGFYWDIRTLPFPLSENQKEFYLSIQNFDLGKYCRGVEEYLDRLGTYEDKDSIEKTVSWLEKQWMCMEKA